MPDEILTLPLMASHVRAGDEIALGDRWHRLTADARRLGLHTVELTCDGRRRPFRIEDCLLVVRRRLEVWDVDSLSGSTRPTP